MPKLVLNVLSLAYSSWSMRAWLTLTHAGAVFEKNTVQLPHMHRQGDPSDEGTGLAVVEPSSLEERRALGSVRGLFPVLWVDGVPIHESLAICEHVAETFPDAGLWPDDALSRAQARSISCEMLSGFTDMRDEMSCHLFGRVPGFVPGEAARRDIARVLEIWSRCLERSGGPLLFGRFGIADAMYYPVLTRFRTYGVALAEPAERYARALDAAPAVRRLIEVARFEPSIPVYDDYLRRLGGDPKAGLHAA
jgi:glutathione S-transferase